MEVGCGIVDHVDVDVALKQIAADLDALLHGDLTPATGREATDRARLVEAVRTRSEALAVRMTEAVDASGTFAESGHRSGQTFCAHAAKLSPATARRRGQLTRAVMHLPAVRRRFEAGELGADQAQRIASAMSNSRARDGLAACDELIADRASAWRYDDFSEWLADLVQAADPDGTRDTNQRAHERRDALLVQEYDGTWLLKGGWAALEGAELHEIVSRFVDAEFQADLEEARRRLDDDEVPLEELDRTPGQRRADAMLAMARAAARTGVGANGSRVVTNVVIDQATFERELARLAGSDVDERVPGKDDGYRCHTLDGNSLEPTEVATQALLGHVRRVVIGADSVTIDLGRERRLFTDHARLAALIGFVRCCWPGCSRPVSRCEIDHVVEWHEGGRTDQRNAWPLCGPHNRHKYRERLRARRHADGTWTLHRSDGSTID